MAPGVKKAEILAQPFRQRSPVELFPFVENPCNMAQRRGLAQAPENLVLRFHEAHRNTTNPKSPVSLVGHG